MLRNDPNNNANIATLIVGTLTVTGNATIGGTLAVTGAITGPSLTAIGSTTLTLAGKVADGASAVGVAINNTVALSNAGAKIESYQNNSVEKAYVKYDGGYGVSGVAASGYAVTLPRSTRVGNPTDSSYIEFNQFSCAIPTGITCTSVGMGSGTGLVNVVNSSAALTVRGNFTDGASAIGVISDNSATLSTNGSLLHSFRNNGTQKAAITKTGSPVYDFTDDSGTTGSRTVNTASGWSAFAGSATAITITNSVCKAASTVYAVLLTNDATAQIKNVVPAAGSFTINIVAATGTTKVGWVVVNGN